jgi:hypothetical protein
LKPRLTTPVKDETVPLGFDLDYLSAGQPRESNSVDQNKCQGVILEQDIENRTADAERAGGCFDLIAAGLLDAGDEAEGTLGRIEDHLAGASHGIEDIFVEPDLRTGADAQAGLIPEKKLRIAVVAGAHDFIGKHLAADR